MYWSNKATGLVSGYRRKRRFSRHYGDDSTYLKRSTPSHEAFFSHNVVRGGVSARRNRRVGGIVLAAAHNPGGVWQGQPCIAGARAAPLSSAASRFLVLDTGGSGGGFGQGDARDSLRDAFFWNEKLGWACGYGGVFKTEDGGLSWKRMKPRGDWQQLKMTGPEELWLLEGRHPGGPGMAWLWHSTDGGKNLRGGRGQVGRLLGLGLLWR